jgi:hypothetical protein
MVSGTITLGPIEFLAVAALPLGAISSILKRALLRRFGLSESTSSRTDE